MPIKKEDRDRYGPHWDGLAWVIKFIKAQGFCEWCGAEHGKPHPISGKRTVLTVAHLWDHRPEAQEWLNLAALCMHCHLAFDHARHVEKAKATRARKARERLATTQAAEARR
jgi:5-methylcytosine-specific restriction endonuclease McrA